MEEEVVQFTMRMEKNLYEQLKESAKANRRSIAKELEYLTDLHLNRGTPIEVSDEVAAKLIELLRTSEGFNKLTKSIELDSNGFRVK